MIKTAPGLSVAVTRTARESCTKCRTQNKRHFHRGYFRRKYNKKTRLQILYWIVHNVTASWSFMNSRLPDGTGEA